MFDTLEGIPPLTAEERAWAQANSDSQFVRGVIPNPWYWAKRNPDRIWMDSRGTIRNPWYVGPEPPQRGVGPMPPVPAPGGSGGFPPPFSNGGTLNSNRFDYLGGAGNILGSPPLPPSFGLPPHIPGPPSIIGRGRPTYRTQRFPLSFRSG